MASGVDETGGATDRPAPRRLGELDRRVARRHLIVALLRATAASAAIVVAYALLPFEAESAAGIVVRIGLSAIVVAAFVTWEVKKVASADLPQVQAIEALPIAVTLMVVMFAAAYHSMSLRDPTAFDEALDRTSALYFTMTTLSTIGYGDIVAKTDAGRIVVMVQMVFNVAVIGLSVRLIAGTARRRLGTDGSGPTRP
jgi:Ion channel